jgi:O-antigen/teichoic acid export membrane protein
MAISILLLISAFFLADALRRLRNEYKADKRLDVNRNIMCLHVIALFNHTFILVVAQFFIVYSFLRPSEKSKDQLNIARIFMFGSQAISMTIVIYLFMKFALPTSSMSKKEERDVIVTRLSELR